MDETRKVLEYLAVGSSEVRVIDIQNREILAQAASGFRILGAEEALESPLLPGFSALLRDLLT